MVLLVARLDRVLLVLRVKPFSLHRKAMAQGVQAAQEQMQRL